MIKVGDEVYCIDCVDESCKGRVGLVVRVDKSVFSGRFPYHIQFGLYGNIQWGSGFLLTDLTKELV